MARLLVLKFRCYPTLGRQHFHFPSVISRETAPLRSVHSICLRCRTIRSLCPILDERLRRSTTPTKNIVYHDYIHSEHDMKEWFKQRRERTPRPILRPVKISWASAAPGGNQHRQHSQYGNLRTWKATNLGKAATGFPWN
jgi:hypothetical protein